MIKKRRHLRLICQIGFTKIRPLLTSLSSYDEVDSVCMCVCVCTFSLVHKLWESTKMGWRVWVSRVNSKADWVKQSDLEYVNQLCEFNCFTDRHFVTLIIFRKLFQGKLCLKKNSFVKTSSTIQALQLIIAMVLLWLFESNHVCC